MALVDRSVVVRLLGSFQVTYAGVKIPFPTRKAIVLFAFLVFNRGKRVSRDRLTNTLWPDLEDGRARRNLRTTLWRLNRAIQDIPAIQIETDREFLSLDYQDTSVDTSDFLTAIEAADNLKDDARVMALQEAEHLYSGDFLEGLDNQWCEDERRVFRSAYYDLIRKLARVFKERSEYTRSIAYLRRLLQLDPYDEAVHRDLMLAYYVAGSGSTALAHFAELKKILSADLGIAPSQETADVCEHIRIQIQWVFAQKASKSRPSLAGLPSTERFETLPLIGRENELGEIIASLERARQGLGGATIIHGDPGIGKTKLVEAAITESRLRGFNILQARCPDLESAPPYQVLIQAIWPRVLAGFPPSSVWSPVINALAEAISADRPAPPRDTHLAAVDSSLLNECILSALSDPADRSATLLVLEDLHRVDRATESFLIGLFGRLGKMKLHVLVTLRSDEGRGREFIAALSSNGGEQKLLKPLESEDVARLIAAALGTDAPAGELSEFIWERCAGVPLFSLELLKFLVVEGCFISDEKGSLVLDKAQFRARSSRMPSVVSGVIRHQIGLLNKKAKSLLLAAAVLGMEASYENLELMLGNPEDEFIESVEDLVGTRLVHETETGLRFAHETVRQTAREFMSKARLHSLHARAASILEKTMPGRTSELAWHFSEAGMKDKAVTYFEFAGDKAKVVNANEDAVRWYTRALGVLELLDRAEPTVLRRRASVLLKRQEVLELVGDREQQSGDIDDLRLIAAKLRDHRLEAHGALLRSQLLSRLNRCHEALESAREAEAVFVFAEDKSGTARAVEAMSVAYMNLRDEVGTRVCSGRALSLFNELGDRAGQARALLSLGTAMAFGGRTIKAMNYIVKAERILRELGDQRPLAGSLLQKGLLHRYLGENSKSEISLLRGIEILRQIGDRIGEARGLSQLACTHAADGRLRDALHESLRAIRLARESGDIRALIMLLNNAAFSVYRYLGDWRRAEHCISSIFEMVKESGGLENAAIYCDTAAAIYIEKGESTVALSWAKQARAYYRASERHPAFLDPEIGFRFALIYLSLEDYQKAYPLLLRAIGRWRRVGELAPLAQGIGHLGYLKLKMGDLKGSLACARELEGLLRKADGIDQLQKLYWYQYHIYRKVGSNAAARKALRKALSCVAEQAAQLKGRLRRRFLTYVQVNREILSEATRLRMVVSSHSDLRLADRSRYFLLTEVGLPVQEGQRNIIEARRKALIDLFRSGHIRQKEMAAQLGVSVRTIRSDLVSLRNQGLLSKMH